MNQGKNQHEVKKILRLCFKTKTTSSKTHGTIRKKDGELIIIEGKKDIYIK